MYSSIEKIDKNSDKIIIFVHGFMGSPTQFNELMDFAYENGFSVVSLLLPGHGKSGFSFAMSTLRSWEEYLDNQLRRFASYKVKYIVGHSIGGLLALNASLKFDLDGIVLISTPLKIYLFKPTALLKRFKLLFNRVEPHIKETYKNSKSIGRPYLISMPLWFRVLSQPHILMRKTRKNLAKVHVPVLIIHSESDETASIKSSALFDTLLLNSQHEIVMLKESWHAFYTEEEKEIIRAKISDFIST
ncbi:MAG: alpha/beta fold hydrolase [Eubacteriales bacterium]|nr:alpha/beta fold hydrolase [Eubacteriales bacterium]